MGFKLKYLSCQSRKILFIAFFCAFASLRQLFEFPCHLRLATCYLIKPDRALNWECLASRSHSKITDS